MSYNRDEWLKEFSHLKMFMQEEGMSAEIGMPFTLMLSLLESAKNYMIQDIAAGKGDSKERLPELNKQKYGKLRATTEYLDWKRLHDEYR